MTPSGDSSVFRNIFSVIVPLACAKLAHGELDGPEFLRCWLGGRAAGRRNILIALRFGDLLEHGPDQMEPLIPNDREKMLGRYVEVERLPGAPSSRARRHLCAGAVVPLRRRPARLRENV